MRVLSLFDGISCGQIALERAGFKVDKYFAYEIDKYAIQITQENYPNTIQCGDVAIADFTQYKDNIDILIGGSPCQGFSFAGKQLNFDDPKSKLFFEFVRALNEVQPKYFLLENVKMKKEYSDIISYYLGVEPIEFNSSLVSAQLRPRLYWTNIKNITVPKNKNIILKNILEINVDEKYRMSKKMEAKLVERNQLNVWKSLKSYNKAYRVMYKDRKSVCLDTAQGGGRTPYVYENGFYRKLTPIECERLQTLPDNYTNGLSDSNRYKCIGNGWTVDIIAHILSFLKEAYYASTND